MTINKELKIALILGIRLNSTNLDEVLKLIIRRLQNNQKTFIVTPNPEFAVYAQNHLGFAKILNSADIAVPDGIGLVWAARILNRVSLTRIHGADLVEQLMKKATINCWQVGIVGARRGVLPEVRGLLVKLEHLYPRVKFYIIETTPNWQKVKLDLVFACQGMGKQEKWIHENYKASAGLIYIGAGGSLDYLAGLVPRAPIWMRRIDLEWLYRLIRQPWRLARQLNLIKFVYLVVKEKIAP